MKKEEVLANGNETAILPAAPPAGIAVPPPDMVKTASILVTGH